MPRWLSGVCRVPRRSRLIWVCVGRRLSAVLIMCVCMFSSLIAYSRDRLNTDIKSCAPRPNSTLQIYSCLVHYVSAMAHFKLGPDFGTSLTVLHVLVETFLRLFHYVSDIAHFLRKLGHMVFGANLTVPHVLADNPIVHCAICAVVTTTYICMDFFLKVSSSFALLIPVIRWFVAGAPSISFRDRGVSALLHGH